MAGSWFAVDALVLCYVERNEVRNLAKNFLALPTPFTKAKFEGLSNYFNTFSQIKTLDG